MTMDICEELSKVETDVANRRDGLVPFDTFDLSEKLHAIREGAVLATAVPIAIRLCRQLHSKGRSFEALPIAQAMHERAVGFGATDLAQPTANACGLLALDTADYAGAIDFHGRALTFADEAQDRIASSRVWNNIGCVLNGVGQYDSAMRCFQRVLERVEEVSTPQFSRFSAYTNLASCEFHLGDVESGLFFAEHALSELQRTNGDETFDLHSQILLRRNMVRLLIDDGRVAEAEVHAHQALCLSRREGGLRSSIAAATTLAILDIATGKFDVALTRLDRSLADSRSVWPAFRDTLTCAIRAEEAVGNPEKALVRLHELAALIHDRGRESALRHLKIARWRDMFDLHDAPGNEILDGSKARLQARRNPPSAPATWQTYSRLAVGNALQVDASSVHGLRVGAMTRLLAQASGIAPIDAMEIGLAAQLHDIGLAAGHENLLAPHASLNAANAHLDAMHCEAGWQILGDESNTRLLLARDIAKYHHAWWSGRGYPAGVAGLAIPVHARMVAVADVFDSLLEDAPRDHGRSIDHALNQLERFAGTQLDPKLVTCFIDAVRHEGFNEGVSFVAEDGLTCFHQLIATLTSARNYL